VVNGSVVEVGESEREIVISILIIEGVKVKKGELCEVRRGKRGQCSS
jgi:hypothetical protein